MERLANLLTQGQDTCPHRAVKESGAVPARGPQIKRIRLVTHLNGRGQPSVNSPANMTGTNVAPLTPAEINKILRVRGRLKSTGSDGRPKELPPRKQTAHCNIPTLTNQMETRTEKREKSVAPSPELSLVDVTHHGYSMDVSFRHNSPMRPGVSPL